MTRQDIQAEARLLWESYFEEVGRASQYDANFEVMLSEYEERAELEASEALQPWLHILQDSIQWLANLWGILARQLDADDVGDNRLRSTWALVGASVAHAVAVRRLVASGLDTPARAIARALDEHLCACIAVLHDRALAEGFQRSQDVADAKRFWHQNLSTRAIREVLSAVEQEIGLPSDTSEDMRAWRQWEVTALSQAIHPSYVNAILTAKTISATDPRVHSVSILGSASAGSERTLNFACKSIWYFSRLGFMIMYNSYAGQPPVVRLDAGDEMHQVALVGRDVLAALNRKYWDHEIFQLNEEA